MKRQSIDQSINQSTEQTSKQKTNKYPTGKNQCSLKIKKTIIIQ